MSNQEPGQVKNNVLLTAYVIAGVLAVAGLGVLGVAIGSASSSGHSTSMGSSSSSPAGPVAIDPVVVDTAGLPSGGVNPGIFTDTCQLTLTAPNDPILMPGMTGKSMQHNFFGNLDPTSSSTPASLVGQSTNCSTSADASAYWTPVLYQEGKALEPRSTLIYWRAPASSAATVQSIPAGITLIAGKEDATTPQDAHVIGWTCSGKLTGKLASVPTDCPSGSYLRLVATFPNCWDGHSLDGSTQQNVVYATMSGCPASYPVQIPQVVVHVNYPTASASGLTLSIGPTQQGSILTGHADFMDGWDQATMSRNVTACIDTQTRCGAVTGAQATPRGGVQR